MDRSKVIQCITRNLNKATDAELRTICGATYHITKRKIYHQEKPIIFRGGNKMGREEMLEQIFDNLREASDATVEQAYWFLMLEIEN